MANNIEPKCKQCRREGEKLFLKGDRCYTSKCPIVSRNYPPGLHGPKGRPRLTDYGVQLRTKQKAKRYYGLLERQFRKYYEESANKKGETALNLLQMLESRLDNVVYRAGFAKSRKLARQLVSHGHFLVNGEKVNIPSYQVSKGDLIEIAESSKKDKYFEIRLIDLEKYEVPNWVSMDPKELKARYLDYPTIEQVAPIFDLKYIVEFYSR